MTPDKFIAMIAPAARAMAVKSKIPASFTVGQAALESGWCTSKPALNAMNLFNIKADAAWGNRPIYQMASEEVIKGKKVVVPANWRMYPDWLASISDHAAFLTSNPRYVACFKAIGGEAWARAVAAAGYATDPDYSAKLIATMRGHSLASLDRP